MKAQQRLDKILDIVNEKVQEEVKALIGADFKMASFANQTMTKGEYFDSLAGKKILAKMDLTGELEGVGCLVVDIRDGIRLGGILIMLPQSELEEVVKGENYTEETEDSFGEIANIIAGAFTKVFEENYPKNFRVVRKEQEIISPVKVVVDSDEPVPDQIYYLVRAKMTIDSNAAGNLDFLLPAEIFGLVTPQNADAEQSISQQSLDRKMPEKAEETTMEEPKGEKEILRPSASPLAPEAVAPSVQKQSGIADKHRKLVDSLLEQSCETYAREVSALLGVNIKLSAPDNYFTDKESFLTEEVAGKQVLAQMEIVDELNGSAYLFISLKDAIRIGSILIMLPPSELESSVNEEDFSPDAEDAYGEIANIIAGSFTGIFQGQYPQSFRFIKKDLETVAPMKVDHHSDEILPAQRYYANRCRLEIDGVAYGSIQMLLPAELFQLSDASIVQAASEGKETSSSFQEPRLVKQQPPQVAIPGEDVSTPADTDFDVLIIQNNRHEAETIEMELRRVGTCVKTISYNDSIKYFVRDNLRLVIIVMHDVDEQAYSVTIKVNTLSSVPIVAAGSQWTRSKVIKAVKYGIRDILLLPASPDEIREKVRINMVAMAA